LSPFEKRSLSECGSSPSPREFTPTDALVIRGVMSAEAWDEAKILYYDIVDIDVEPGSIQIASNFPYEIRMLTGPVVDFSIERIGPGVAGS
jgi:hypothetical protein